MFVCPNEQDMNNCYREIDKQEALDAVTDAQLRIKDGVPVHHELWFSIAKGGDKHRDRIGKSSCKLFYTISFGEVYIYVLWDVMHNTFFTLQTVLLRQGLKGYPLGDSFQHRSWSFGLCTRNLLCCVVLCCVVLCCVVLCCVVLCCVVLCCVVLCCVVLCCVVSQ